MFQLILKILFYLIIIGFNKNCLAIIINGISSSSPSDIIKNNNNNNNLINSKTDTSNNKLIYSDIKYYNSLFNNNNNNNINNNKKNNKNVNNVIENFIKSNKNILLQKPASTFFSTQTSTKKNINFFNNGNYYISNRNINFDSKVPLNKNNIEEKNNTTITTTTNNKLLDTFINTTSISNKKLSHHSTFNSNIFQIKNLLNQKFKRSTLNRKNKRHHVRRDIIRENLCVNECKCTVVNNFLTVNCEFSESRLYIFGSTKYIPRQATSLVIKLAKHSQFRLDENFFHQNKINRIYIEGATDDSRELIEFGPNAFSGNSGPFPEINIFNCHSVLLRSNAFNGEFKLNITNCKEVDIYSGAFYNTTFHGHLENIKDLRPFERAFTKATAKIDIIHCHIHQLYRLDASLKELKFVHSSIHQITSGTFDVISINSIIFENCTIGRIMTGTATGRLFSSHLAIKGCNIDVIESDAIAGSGITEFIFENNNVSVIHENAIDLTTIQATIAHNKINSLGYNWFHVHGWSHIIIKNNQFGNFNRLTVEKTSNPVECTFEENFITNAEWQSLNFTSTYCKLKEISFFHPCTCNLEWLLNLTSADIKSESYCTIDDTLKYCFNTSIINVDKYYQDICVTSEQTLDCMKKKVNKQIENHFIHPNDLNRNDSSNYSTRTLYILIGSIILAIVIILSSIIIIMCILKKKCHKNESDTTSFEMSSTHEFTTTTFKNSQLQFSTADRLIINQTLENMKRKYPTDKYDQVYNNTKKLLHGHLSESEKVSTISEIIRNIRECSNSGDDFVAFNDILYKHLAPTTNAATPTTTTTTTEMATAPTNNELIMEQNPNDPVYEEPNLIQNHPNFNHINNRNNDNLVNFNLTNEPIIILDHIYNEPNNVQQPLLTNEYSAPIDRNEQFNLYSEPLPQAGLMASQGILPGSPNTTSTTNRDKSRNIISPYAISGNNCDDNNQKSLHNNNKSSSSSAAAQNFDQQKPCSSKNLPDILNEQSKSPLRSTVQKLSDTFSNINNNNNSNNNNNNNNNSNNKYLTRSPLSNRNIPKYTIPNTKFKIRSSTSPPPNSDNIDGLVSLGAEPVSQDTASDHSGGSDVTLPIDDRIDYADS